jgi:hypothetical protein
MRAVGARGSGRWGGTVDYPCVDRGYRFRLLDRHPYVAGEVYELFDEDCEPVAQAAAG